MKGLRLAFEESLANLHHSSMSNFIQRFAFILKETTSKLKDISPTTYLRHAFLKQDQLLCIARKLIKLIELSTMSLKFSSTLRFVV